MRSFKQQLNQANRLEVKLALAQKVFDATLVELRKVCPHLEIAQGPGGGRLIRICRTCGIQEVQWESAFGTLTAPGGTWFGSIHDKSLRLRGEQAPVIYPMSSDKAYCFRRGPHLDVTIG